MRALVTGGTGRVGSVVAELAPRRVEDLLGRVGSPDDVADAVLYLARAGFVTGTSPCAGRGQTAQIRHG